MGAICGGVNIYVDEAKGRLSYDSTNAQAIKGLPRDQRSHRKITKDRVDDMVSLLIFSSYNRYPLVAKS